MSLFDRIYMPVVCPRCGDAGEKEVQTKALACEMKRYHVGDDVGDDITITIDIGGDKWIEGNVCCMSLSCRTWEQEKYKEFSVGRGYCWNVRLYIDNGGRITNKVENVRDPLQDLE